MKRKEGCLKKYVGLKTSDLIPLIKQGSSRMATKIDVDQLSSKSGNKSISDASDVDSHSRVSSSKPEHGPVTSSNTSLYVTMVVVCLLGLNTVSVYQVHKLEVRVQRLEADFAVGCSTKPVNGETPPNDRLRSPSPQLIKSSTELPLQWLARSQPPNIVRNKYPSHSRNTGSGVAVDDVDAEEDGSSDLDLDFDAARVVRINAPDDFIEGSGDDPFTADAGRQEDITRQLVDPEASLTYTMVVYLLMT